MTAHVLPRVGLNGTHPDRLLEAACAARDALRDALEALDDCAPNPRDYPAHVFPAAQAAHQARVESLKVIDDYLLDLAIHLDDAGAAR